MTRASASVVEARGGFCLATSAFLERRVLLSLSKGRFEIFHASECGAYAFVRLARGALLRS